MASVKDEDADADLATLAEAIEIIDDGDDGDSKPNQFDLVGVNNEEDEIECLEEVETAFKRESTILPSNSTRRERVQVRGQSLTCGMTVELQDGDFLRIARIDASPTGIYLRGNLMRRSWLLKGQLDKKLNEVCLIMQTEFREGAEDAKLNQCLTTRRLEDTVKIRQCILTNLPFPVYSCREDPQFTPLFGLLSWDDLKPILKEEASLVCRWRWTQEVGLTNKVIAESLMQLKENECDTNRHCSDVLRRRGYGRKDDSNSDKARDKTEPKAAPANLSATPIIDLTGTANRKRSHAKSSLESRNTVDLTTSSDEDSDIEIIDRTVTQSRMVGNRHGQEERRTIITHTERIRTNGQFSLTAAFATNKVVARRVVPQVRVRVSRNDSIYTYADLFTGAGGMASGAWQAGLRLIFLLDHWDDACDTLKMNFNTIILQEHISVFCQNESMRTFLRVDILHISFPCQPHSPAHTKEGKNDGANIAAGYSVDLILENCRPRIVTFEQTSGMLTHNDKIHFHALIRQITDKGYSVRWRICNLAEYGNYQPRRRLIIIAACPGEKLPTFPPTTHGVGYGKKRFPTIADALDKVDRARVRHKNDPNMRYSYPHIQESYSPNQPLRAAITCSGGAGNNHPDGKRTFTNFELAQLQSFPVEHRFAGVAGSVKKQIGNAVPSVFAKTLFEHIVKSLEESDRCAAAYRVETVELE